MHWFSTFTILFDDLQTFENVAQTTYLFLTVPQAISWPTADTAESWLVD